MMRRSILLTAAVAYLSGTADAADPLPLQLVGKIALGDVSGRIDHMSIDHARHRLFVAELGNNSVAVVDLVNKTVVRRISGLSEPQGVIYAPDADRVLVANGGDGSVRSYAGDTLEQTGKLELKRDADNLRLDSETGLVWVGYGDGALAAIVPRTLEKKADVVLSGHPEAFQLSPSSSRTYLNIPDAREIAVVDRATGKQVASWKTSEARANFPMALADDGKKIISVFRGPTRLLMYDASSGTVLANVTTCGDADDVFADEARHRLYVSCGSGSIDVYTRTDRSIEPLTRITTSGGARTSFFDAEGDRLYLAVRAGLIANAEIWVFQPN